MKEVPIPVPLLEREPEEIRSELARFFGIRKSSVRITKLTLGDGRNVAYIRLVWREGALMPEKPEPPRKLGRPKKRAAQV